MNSRVLLFAGRCTWALVMVAFAAIGVREVSIGAVGKFIPAGPSASTDAYLKTLLGIQQPSRICTELINRLDAAKPIIFLCPPRDAESDFVYYTMAYLTWPRQIRKVTVEPDGLTNLVSTIDRARTALIFSKFHDLPEFAGSQRVGPNLLVVPAATPK